MRGQAWLPAHVSRLRALDVPSLPAQARMLFAVVAAAVAATVAAAVSAAPAKADKAGCFSGRMRSEDYWVVL